MSVNFEYKERVKDIVTADAILSQTKRMGEFSQLTRQGRLDLVNQAVNLFVSKMFLCKEISAKLYAGIADKLFGHLDTPESIFENIDDIVNIEKKIDGTDKEAFINSLSKAFLFASLLGQCVDDYYDNVVSMSMKFTGDNLAQTIEVLNDATPSTLLKALNETVDHFNKDQAAEDSKPGQNSQANSDKKKPAGEGKASEPVQQTTGSVAIKKVNELGKIYTFTSKKELREFLGVTYPTLKAFLDGKKTKLNETWRILQNTL